MPTQNIHSSVVNAKTAFGCSYTPLSHSVSIDGNAAQSRLPMLGISTSQCTSLPPSITASTATSLPVEKTAIFGTPKFELSEDKPSNTSIPIDSATKRARYGSIRVNKTIPTVSSPCSIYMVDEVHHSNQELSSSPMITMRPRSGPIFLPGCKRPPKITTPVRIDPILTTPDCEQSNGTKKRFLLKKQVSEDVNRGNLAQKQKNTQCNISTGLNRYSGQNRSLRSFQGTSNEGSVSPGVDFARCVLQLYMYLEILTQCFLKKRQIILLIITLLQFSLLRRFI